MVRDTKFFKTVWSRSDHRLPPLEMRSIGRRRRSRCPWERTRACSPRTQAKDGPISRLLPCFSAYAVQLRSNAPKGVLHSPRLHDLRHTAAVHHVLAWYRDGKDVQRLLPQLATYLGHVDIRSTQRYLHMTPELLEEASRRFAQYAQCGDHHEMTETCLARRSGAFCSSIWWQSATSRSTLEPATATP